jgi:hypothetical protein
MFVQYWNKCALFLIKINSSATCNLIYLRIYEFVYISEFQPSIVFPVFPQTVVDSVDLWFLVGKRNVGDNASLDVGKKDFPVFVGGVVVIKIKMLNSHHLVKFDPFSVQLVT